MRNPTNKKKVVVLGIDAMDPKITEWLMEEGRLPNLSSVKAKGSYARLTTTNPSESIVAWTTFATGLNPASHGIFDFILLNPKDYHPYLSFTDVTYVRGRLEIKIHKKGKSFWSILSQNQIPCFIYFCPNTFPADSLLGKMLSGMGVPDILGTMGKFTFYTTKALSEEDRESRGEVIKVGPVNNIIYTQLLGPRISFGGQVAGSTIPLKVVIGQKRNIYLGFQKNKFFLKEGKWSGWKKVFFKVSPLRKINGIVKFYLKSIKPEFELYASPINFNPHEPPFSISHPEDYAHKLAERIGLYHTQGSPYDTWALTENRFDEKVFLEHVNEIFNENKKILNEGLKEFKGGVFFFYFGILDAIQHLFWRYIDPKHLLYEKNSPYQETIHRYYEKIDAVIGEVLKGVDRDTILIVLSDHGFAPSRKAMHLNRWLLENGYLYLKEGVNESKGFLEYIDWKKTKAYALGFGGIYVNKIGREFCGIVSESEIENLKKEIKEGLKQFRATNGETAVKDIYTQEQIFHGPYMCEAPDLFVGFNEGWRASWQTAGGAVPTRLFEDNTRKWSGDHICDPALVPGVIFANKKIELKNPSLIDITPTILALFDIAKTDEMGGEALFKNQVK